ncbi:MAG: hypothetical protein CMH30_08350 [Micavibrio sp.]|nr:hypothetical protein [Micavibrio sp.]|tara:strand:- start:8604 stop:9098 length:495 start_codon:yes stop_codon:yes gene_type:complete
MNKNFLAIVMTASLALAGCTGMNNPSSPNTGGVKQGVGTVGGAVLGGLAGSQVGGGSGQLWATGAGALLGAYLGGEVGKSLDRADMLAMENARMKAQSAPIGQQISWNNPETGNNGTITPIRDGKTSSGEYCREYQQTIVVGGKEERAFGTACQQADGSWKVVN